MSINERIAKIETKMDDLGATVLKLEHAIYGNGTPGLLSDVRVIRKSVERHHQAVDEKTQEKKSDWKWLVSTVVAIAAVIVAFIGAVMR